MRKTPCILSLGLLVQREVGESNDLEVGYCDRAHALHPQCKHKTPSLRNDDLWTISRQNALARPQNR